MFIFVGLAVGVVPLLLGGGLTRLLGVHRPDSEKLSPYECGFEAFEDARMKFDVRYYLIAILFILFDLEIAFLFPWAVVLREIGFFGFMSMLVFLAILVVGFVYEWMKGAALEWVMRAGGHWPWALLKTLTEKASSRRPRTSSSTGRAPGRCGR